jgi:hypothetical protein
MKKTSSNQFFYHNFLSYNRYRIILLGEPCSVQLGCLIPHETDV